MIAAPDFPLAIPVRNSMQTNFTYAAIQAPLFTARLSYRWQHRRGVSADRRLVERIEMYAVDDLAQ